MCRGFGHEHVRLPALVVGAHLAAPGNRSGFLFYAAAVTKAGLTALWNSREFVSFVPALTDEIAHTAVP